MTKITELDELKVIELEIMKQIHFFCSENDITYYLAAGTLIGAMRHQGFIPWDDDIDIWMPRPDYEKFLMLFPDWGHERKLEIANHKSKVFFGRAMTKVFDSRTKLLEPEFRSDDPIGVFVDIWPLDGTPNERTKRTHHMTKAKILHKLLYRCVTKPSTSSVKSVVKAIIGLPFQFYSSKRIVDRIELLAKENSYENSELVYCPAYPMVLMDRKSFGHPVLAQFEDSKFCIPIDYDLILTQRYGTWKELPPKQEQKPHHVLNAWWLE